MHQNEQLPNENEDKTKTKRKKMMKRHQTKQYSHSPSFPILFLLSFFFFSTLSSRKLVPTLPLLMFANWRNKPKHKHPHYRKFTKSATTPFYCNMHCTQQTTLFSAYIFFLLSSSPLSSSPSSPPLVGSSPCYLFF